MRRGILFLGLLTGCAVLMLTVTHRQHLQKRLSVTLYSAGLQ